MTGYWEAPEMTAAVSVPGGGVRTGDLGWIDEQGRLHLVGRTREMYVRGGENVFPMEVEGVLADAPGVAAVTVVARSDDTWGEVGVAVVVPAPGATAPTVESLRAHAADRLARFKLPESVVVVDALPLTPMEKVDRRALAELVERRLT
jgi:acyl-CoA synthetase (AMP-forming)/AMP-acid ligase II